MVAKLAGAAVHAATEVARAPRVESFSKALGGAAKPAARPTAPPKPQPRPQARALLTEVASAQARLDQLLKLAESGRTFSPAELLAFQTHAYRASQELDLAGKVVEKATSGVKQTLNTQV